MSETYPAPHVVPPKTKHTTTFIFLHGTSGNGQEFDDALLNTSFIMQDNSLQPNNIQAISLDNHSLQLDTLRDIFPGTRWVFPTGRQRYVTVLGRAANAWFDVHDFKDRRIGEMESVVGLRESTEFLGNLVRKEVEMLYGMYGGDDNQTFKRVIVGGFSQGAAMSAILLLSGEVSKNKMNEEPSIAGWIFLSGWLPFRAQMLDLLANNFSGRDSSVVVREYIRRLLGLSTLREDQTRSQQKNKKVWITHGKQDQKMLLEWGQGLRDVLVMVGKEVEMEVFDVGHWWCEETLKAMTRWLYETVE